MLRAYEKSHGISHQAVLKIRPDVIFSVPIDFWALLHSAGNTTVIIPVNNCTCVILILASRISAPSSLLFSRLPSYTLTLCSRGIKRRATPNDCWPTVPPIQESPAGLIFDKRSLVFFDVSDEAWLLSNQTSRAEKRKRALYMCRPLQQFSAACHCCNRSGGLATPGPHADTGLAMELCPFSAKNDRGSVRSVLYNHGVNDQVAFGSPCTMEVYASLYVRMKDWPQEFDQKKPAGGQWGGPETMISRNLGNHDIKVQCTESALIYATIFRDIWYTKGLFGPTLRGIGSTRLKVPGGGGDGARWGGSPGLVSRRPVSRVPRTRDG